MTLIIAWLAIFFITSTHCKITWAFTRTAELLISWCKLYQCHCMHEFMLLKSYGRLWACITRKFSLSIARDCVYVQYHLYSDKFWPSERHHNCYYLLIYNKWWWLANRVLVFTLLILCQRFFVDPYAWIQFVVFQFFLLQVHLFKGYHTMFWTRQCTCHSKNCQSCLERRRNKTCYIRITCHKQLLFCKRFHYVLWWFCK